EEASRARHDIQESDASGGETLQRRLQGVFELLHSREKCFPVVANPDVSRNSANLRVRKGEKPVLHGAVLDRRVGVEHRDEFAAGDAESDIKGAHLAISSRRLKDSDSSGLVEPEAPCSPARN